MIFFCKISLSMTVEIPKADKREEPPPWLDLNEYPFKPHYCEWDHVRLHYIDEGTGPPIVMLHGNPTWSFLYRNFVKHFSSEYRCIVPDFPGFGLSTTAEKNRYSPEKFAQSVDHLIKHLNLDNITLMVHDWGGPVGMWYAVNNPGKIASLIVMNSWMWPVAGELKFELFSRFFGSSFGKILITRFGLFTRWIMRLGFGTPSGLQKNIHDQYLQPFLQKERRLSQWILVRSLRGSGDWLKKIWEKRDSIAEVPTLFVWGMQDPMFSNTVLSRWSNTLKNHKIIRLNNAGHYVPEQIDEGTLEQVADFLHQMYT